MNPEDLLIGEGDGPVQAFKSFLGIQREAFVCPDCNEACTETHVHDPARAAFDGGSSPAWHCEVCGSDYVREADDSQHAMDLYGRGPPE